MPEQTKDDSAKIVIIVLIVIIIALLLLLNRANNVQFDNTDKNYKESVFKTYGDCEAIIMETIEYRGDNGGYYCYETTDTYGKTIWRIGNIHNE